MKSTFNAMLLGFLIGCAFMYVTYPVVEVETIKEINL
jgi:hypothetical protein